MTNIFEHPVTRLTLFKFTAQESDFPIDKTSMFAVAGPP